MTEDRRDRSQGIAPGAAPAAATRLTFTVGAEAVGQRLDVFAAGAVDGLSRSRAQTLIDDGAIRVNDADAKASTRLELNDRVRVDVPPTTERVPDTAAPAKIDVDVLHVDDHVIVVNKPVGLVVHPGPGHSEDTLVNGLLGRFPDLRDVFGGKRPGIVHRLDRDTSGVMVVARTADAAIDLKRQFRQRAVTKIYAAAVQGRLAQPRAVIDAPIGRDDVQRKKMVARSDGRPARTAYRVLAVTGDYSILEARPETGRTHQIRVHLALLGHAIVGDRVYGRRSRKGRRFDRLGLHAYGLGFAHPADGRQAFFKAPFPADFRDLLRELGVRPEAIEAELTHTAS